jgi:hypothetical protein
MPNPSRMARLRNKSLKRKRSTRRALRRRRLTRRVKQRGGTGDIPNDLNTVVDHRDGNDIDSVVTPMSMEKFDEVNASANPDEPV